MAGAVVAVASVVAGVASAVASVVAPIVSAIAAVIGPAVAAIGSVIGAIVSTIGTALGPIIESVGSIGSWVIETAGQTVGGLVDTIAESVKPIASTIKDAIGTIAKGIDAATKPILEPIKGGLEVIKGAIDKVGEWVTTAFHPSAEMEALKTAHPDMWVLAEGSEELFIQDLVSSGVISSTKASLLGLPDVIQTINQAATLKVLADLVQGQANVSDLLDEIAEGKSLETAAAVAELSKSIITTTVGIMDRVDTEVGILRATIDGFDEQLERSLQQYAEQTKAEILAAFTPELDVLGKHQLEVNRKIASIVRHIDDRAWFAAMLARALP